MVSDRYDDEFYPGIVHAWERFLAWTDATNFDVAGLASILNTLQGSEELTELGRRAAEVLLDLPFAFMYFMLTAVTPLLISFTILLLYKPALRILWFFSFTTGVIFILTGVLTRSIISEERLFLLNVNVGESGFSSLTMVGLCIVAFTLLLQGGAKWLELKGALMKAKFKMRLAAERAKRKDVSALRRSLLAAVSHQRYGAPKPPAKLIRSLVCCIGLLALGASMDRIMGSLDTSAQEAIDLHTPFMHPVVQSLLIISGCMFGVHFVLCLFEKGRKLLSDLAALFDATCVGLFLLLLSLLYTPINKYLLAVFECTSLTCGEGEWYPKFAHSLEDSVVTAASLDAIVGGACTACMFYEYGTDGVTPLTPSPTPFDESRCSALAVCPGEEVTVLKADNTLSCGSHVRPFYWPASFLTFIGFTLCVARLYYVLVARHVKLLDEVPIDVARLRELQQEVPTRRYRLMSLLCCCCSRVCRRVKAKKDAAIAWDHRVLRSRNRAKSLCVHSLYERRYHIKTNPQ